VCLCSPAPDDGRIQQVKFNFVKLHHLDKVAAGKVLDVLGVVLEERPSTEITTKKGDKLLKKDLVIGDESGTSVQLTLWG
jgi:replication factor A1